MAAIGNGNPTLLDLAKRATPDGSIDTQIVELLHNMHEINDDVVWVEGNLPTGHRTTLRTSLPTASYRRFNEGVATGKSTTAQIEETCAMMEAYSEVDVRLKALYGAGGGAWRASEDTAWLEAMNQQWASDLFLASKATDPDKFDGFYARYNDVNYGESSSGAKDGAVVDGGGTGSDNTSMWLIGWGTNTVHGIVPKGTTAGLKMENLGEDTKVDANGKMYQVERTHITWDVGLCIRDWRYVTRIANLDVSTMQAVSGHPELFRLAARAVDRIPNVRGAARFAWYCNRPVKSFLSDLATSKASNQLTRETVENRPVTFLMGYPIRTVDALGIAESQLT